MTTKISAETRWSHDSARAMAMSGGGTDLEKRRKAMLFLYNLGYSNPRIGALFSVTRQRVHAILHDLVGGGYLDAIAAERAAMARIAIPAFRAGKPRAEVASRCGMTQSELNAMVVAARKAGARSGAPAWAQPLLAAILMGQDVRRFQEKMSPGTGRVFRRPLARPSGRPVRR